MVGCLQEKTMPLLKNKVNHSLRFENFLRFDSEFWIKPYLSVDDHAWIYQFYRVLPYYLHQHSQPATRGWHYIRAPLALALLIILLITGNFLWLPLVLVSGYAFAWASHGTIEKNKLATFTYPLWSLASDIRMLFCFLTGRMGFELQKAGAQP